MGVLDGTVVLDRTTEIAGPYCGKLLADAGADVVKVEPDGGDPVRRRHSGALFEFLNTSKRSVGTGDAAALLPAADLVVTDGTVLDDTGAAAPGAVVVSLSPF